jgi:hypothetical protein
VEWEISDESSETHAEASVVWLLVWALILPLAHPGRLLCYGFSALLLLIALTALYPEASPFAPILVTSSFDPQPPALLMPHSHTLGFVVPALSGLTIAFLLCVWQRDIVGRFRDPVGPLLTTSIGRVHLHLIASLFLAGFLAGFAALVLIEGPLGFVIGCVVLTPTYARLAFLGPVIASLGPKGALPRALRVGMGHSVGHALIYTLLVLCWLGTLFLVSVSAVDAAVRKHSTLPLLLADCVEVTATFVFILWIAAVPALIVRRRIALQGIDPTAFD